MPNQSLWLEVGEIVFKMDAELVFWSGSRALIAKAMIFAG